MWFYKHRLEICESFLTAGVEEIMARCNKETPSYKAVTYKDPITPLKPVESLNITIPLNVASTVEEQTTVPVSTRVETTKSL